MVNDSTAGKHSLGEAPVDVITYSTGISHLFFSKVRNSSIGVAILEGCRAAFPYRSGRL